MLRKVKSGDLISGVSPLTYLWVCASVLLTGCHYEYGLASGSNLWGGYKADQIYQTQDDMFLISVEQKHDTVWALAPAGAFDHQNRSYNVPTEIREYLSIEKDSGSVPITDGSSYQLHTSVLDVVPRGTRIRCVGGKKYGRWSWFFGSTGWVAIFAEILDGPRAGLIVDVTDLSVKYPLNESRARVLKPDTRLLKLE